jgi:hypothetical protein
MWTKILIFMVVFFLVANPATFKIVRRLLGSWVASAEGLATPAGLVLHSAVFVSLAIFLPKALMRASGYQDDDEEYEDEDGEEYEDDDGEEYEEAPCPPGKVRHSVCRAPRPPAAIVAPGAAPMVTVPAAAAAPMVTVPTTSMYGEQYVGYSAY